MPARSADQRAPLLAEDLAGDDELDRRSRDQSSRARAGVDDVLQERRVAEQHDLLEGGAERADDAQDLGFVVARA